MELDEDHYVDDLVPVLADDDEAWGDLIERYGLAGTPDAVPDHLYLMQVSAIWVRQLGSDTPSHRERAVAFREVTVPAGDAEFWAAAWELHRRRTGRSSPLPPTTDGAPPSAGVVAAPGSAATVTAATQAFAEARLALDGGSLAEARQALSSIRVTLSAADAAEAAALRAEVDERQREAGALIDRATGLLAPTEGTPSAADLELAGELLVRAGELDSGDERPVQVLARVPAPAPSEVVARVIGSTVLLGWTPAPYRFGSVSFVVLCAPAEQGALSRLTATAAGTTDDSELTHQAVVGQELRYGVVATRPGGRDSVVVEASEPVMVLAEVQDLRLQYEGRVVRGVWRRPDGCHRVEVMRTDVDDEPKLLGDGVRRDGFTDEDEVVGDRLYTVRCTYLVGGREVRTTGRTVVVAPQDAPDPVVDTDGAPDGGQYVITWTTPRIGEVVLRCLDEPPPVAVGDRMDLSEMDGMGTLVDTSIETDGGHSRVVLRGATRLAWYLPITTSGSTAVAGQAVLVDHLLPVDGLEAHRRGDEAVASWIWPDQATDAHVVATYLGSTIYNRTVSRAEVDREGGVHVPAGPEAMHLRVIALGSAARGRRQSSSVTVTVPARAPTVYTDTTRRGGQTLLRLLSDRDCRIQRLTVVQQRHRAPSSVHDGDLMTTIDDIDLVAGDVHGQLIGKVRRGFEIAVFPGPHDFVQVRPGPPAAGPLLAR